VQHKNRKKTDRVNFVGSWAGFLRSRLFALGGELDAEPKIGFSKLSLPEKAPLLATS
jgi:hypothetical protein